MTVLIVDDSFVIRKLMEQILRKQGVFSKILIAENGQQAEDIMKEEDYKIDLLLLDMMMPKVNGIEVLKYIREKNIMQNTPIIVFSTDDKNKFEALEHGAHEFLHKPVSELKLIDTINKYIELIK